MYSLLLLTCAAPTPPPPKSFTEESFVGLWDYKYGQQEEGLMWLQPNGIYISRHAPNAQMYYLGVWWVEGDSLCLRETSYHPDAFDRKWSNNWNSYQFKFDMTKLPCFCGRTNYGSEIRFSNRREPESDWLPPFELDN